MASASVPPSQQHPLHQPWCLWYDSKKTAKESDWEHSLVQVSTLNTVEDFWIVQHHTKKPSHLDIGSNYHLFRTGVKPMWEDPANVQGGKWVATIASKDELARLDTLWEELLMSAIGEYLDSGDEVVGVVLGKRRAQVKLAVWTKSKENLEMLQQLGKTFRKELGLEAGTAVEFFPHKDAGGAEFPPAILKA